MNQPLTHLPYRPRPLPVDGRGLTEGAWSFTSKIQRKGTFLIEQFISNACKEDGIQTNVSKITDK